MTSCGQSHTLSLHQTNAVLRRCSLRSDVNAPDLGLRVLVYPAGLGEDIVAADACQEIPIRGNTWHVGRDSHLLLSQSVDEGDCRLSAL